jgi:Uma2 family endonuclease
MTMARLRMPPLRQRRWTRAEYDQLIEKGVFGPEDHVELLDGVLVVREPQGSRHSGVVDLVRAALERAFGKGYYVRGDKPMALDPASEPEPDVAVFPGRTRDYLDALPSAPVLVVEVADSSLALDRLRKTGLYARAGIADYWIVNLVDEVVEVYRQPVKAPSRPYGWKYGSVRLFKRSAVIGPLAAPRARVRVADLLP